MDLEERGCGRRRRRVLRGRPGWGRGDRALPSPVRTQGAPGGAGQRPAEDGNQPQNDAGGKGQPDGENGGEDAAGGSEAAGAGGGQGAGDDEARQQAYERLLEKLGMPNPEQGGADGGSAADGIRRPWELEGDDPRHPGLSEAQLEQLRRQVAVQLARMAKEKGDLPAGFQRLVEEYLEPRVDWRRELQAHLRHALQQQAGYMDQSYARPSRRDHPDFLFPGWVSPQPEVVAVIDTSGSMTDGELAQVLGELDGLMREVAPELRYLAVDAAVHAGERVRRVEEIALYGGGGTNMKTGIAAALELKPPANVILVLTDGYTDWPAHDPAEEGHRVEVIPVILPGGAEPAVEWAKTKAIYVGE